LHAANIIITLSPGVCVVGSALLIAPVFSIHYDILFANGVSINIGENCNLNGDGTSGLLAMDFFVTVKKKEDSWCGRMRAECPFLCLLCGAIFLSCMFTGRKYILVKSSHYSVLI
jgi:hypothetical protein